MKINRQRNLMSLGIVVGALTGAVAAYLLAPQDGKQTKVNIAKKVNNLTQTSILKTQEKLIQLESVLDRTEL